jgi:hypothetical protein
MGTSFYGNLIQGTSYGYRGFMLSSIYGWPLMLSEYPTTIVIDQVKQRQTLLERGISENVLQYMFHEKSHPKEINTIEEVTKRLKLMKSGRYYRSDLGGDEIHLGEEVPLPNIIAVAIPFNSDELEDKIRAITDIPILPKEVCDVVSHYKKGHIKFEEPEIEKIFREVFGE